jgi:hypothetical protein
MHQARVHEDSAFPRVRDDATGHLLSAAALQCWFTAPHGRWRTLNHQSHLEALVVEVEAQDVRDAVAIAERVVADPMATEFLRDPRLRRAAAPGWVTDPARAMDARRPLRDAGLFESCRRHAVDGAIQPEQAG